MKFVAILAVLGLALSPTFAQEAAMPSDGEVSQILGDRIGRDQANVGISVAIIEDGETRFISQGTLSVDDTTPVTPQTLFEAGSITKSFTSLILAQLALEGVIDLDAPISTYLPENTVLPQSEAPITPFTLATHTSGISGLPDEIIARGADNPYTGLSRQVLFDFLAKTELARPVGDEYEYSNVGVALLGVVLEEASGQSFSQLVQTRIFDPLEMTASRLALTGQPIPELATGHDPAREKVAHWDFDAFAAAGALVTNAEDLAKFIAAASGNVETPLKAAFAKMLERPGEIATGQSIAMGWLITDLGQGDVIWHNGGTGGFRSFAGYEKASGNGVVVLSNMATQLGIDDIGMHLLNPSLPLRDQPKWRTAIDIDPGVLPRYLGEYVLEDGSVFSITAEDGQLFAQLTGQPSLPLYAEAEHAFFYRVIDAQLTFEVSGERATALVLHQNGQDYRAPRRD